MVGQPDGDERISKGQMWCHIITFAPFLLPDFSKKGKDVAIKYPYTAKANKYARDIVSGRIDACVYVKQACQRHLDDLQKAKKASYPYKFDRSKSEKIIRFAQKMPHTKGKWAGALISLEPWQCFFFAVPFGWVHKATGHRRFREIYGEIPRKNAKSVKGAIIGNYMFSADGEPGAEVYSAATTQAQAFETFRPAWLMTYRTPGYKNRFDIELGGTEKNPGNMYSLATGSRFEALVGKPGDGSSPHCWINDEYHEAKTDESYDTGKTGMGARENPMMVTMTTAGTNTSYPCYSKRQQVIKLLAGEIINDELFGIIYTIDKDDDWTDFKVWEKANPNIDVSVFSGYLKSQLKTAIQDPRKQNIIKCKNLNIWSNAGSSWLNMVDWEKAGDELLDINDFWGDPVYLGLDLASKIDIASCMALFVRDGHYYLFSNHYIPEERTHGEDMAHYAGWVHDGYMTATGGSRIDFEYIKEDIRAIAKNHDLSGEENGGGCVCNDPWNAQQLITELLKEDIECIEVAQTTPMLSEPMKEIEAALKDGKFHHDGNPVTTWMFGNVVCKPDKKDNVFPYKEGEENKIDGAVATITAMNRAMIDRGEESQGNDGSLLLI